MRSFKGFLVLAIAVVGLSPGLSHGASITINGAPVPFQSPGCPNGTATCRPVNGSYGTDGLPAVTAVFNIGTNSFSSSDTATNDTLRLSNYTLTGAADITVVWSQSYQIGTPGSISYSDHMGGFFAPNRFPPNTGDSAKLDGSISTRNPNGATVLTNLPQLAYTVGPSNNFSPPRSNNNSIVTVVCNFAGTCTETLSNKFTFHLANPSHVINVTNSGWSGTACNEDGLCFPDPDDIRTAVAALTAEDLAAFQAAGGDLGVPEPSTLLLLGTGLAGIFLLGRKRLLGRP
jgi:hypothetical protein